MATFISKDPTKSYYGKEVAITPSGKIVEASNVDALVEGRTGTLPSGATFKVSEASQPVKEYYAKNPEAIALPVDTSGRIPYEQKTTTTEAPPPTPSLSMYHVSVTDPKTSQVLANLNVSAGVKAQLEKQELGIAYQYGARSQRLEPVLVDKNTIIAPGGRYTGGAGIIQERPKPSALDIASTVIFPLPKLVGQGFTYSDELIREGSPLSPGFKVAEKALDLTTKGASNLDVVASEYVAPLRMALKEKGIYEPLVKTKETLFPTSVYGAVSSLPEGYARSWIEKPATNLFIVGAGMGLGAASSTISSGAVKVSESLIPKLSKVGMTAAKASKIYGATGKVLTGTLGTIGAASTLYEYQTTGSTKESAMWIGSLGVGAAIASKARLGVTIQKGELYSVQSGKSYQNFDALAKAEKQALVSNERLSTYQTYQYVLNNDIPLGSAKFGQKIDITTKGSSVYANEKGGTFIDIYGTQQSFLKVGEKYQAFGKPSTFKTVGEFKTQILKSTPSKELAVSTFEVRVPGKRNEILYGVQKSGIERNVMQIGSTKISKVDTITTILGKQRVPARYELNPLDEVIPSIKSSFDIAQRQGAKPISTKTISWLQETRNVPYTYPKKPTTYSIFNERKFKINEVAMPQQYQKIRYAGYSKSIVNYPMTMSLARRPFDKIIGKAPVEERPKIKPPFANKKASLSISKSKVGAGMTTMQELEVQQGMRQGKQTYTDFKGINEAIAKEISPEISTKSILTTALSSKQVGLLGQKQGLRSKQVTFTTQDIGQQLGLEGSQGLKTRQNIISIQRQRVEIVPKQVTQLRQAQISTSLNVTPTIPIIPEIPLIPTSMPGFSLPLQLYSNKPGKKVKFKPKYFASVEAVAFGIKGKMPSAKELETGLNIRPMVR